MQVEQRLWSPEQGWQRLGAAAPVAPSLVRFAAPGMLDDGARCAELRAFYPSATPVGCTTGGEIAPSETSPYPDRRNRTMTITTIGEA